MYEKVEGLRVWQADEGILIGARDKGRVVLQLDLLSESAGTLDEKGDLCLHLDESVCLGCAGPPIWYGKRLEGAPRACMCSGSGSTSKEGMDDIGRSDSLRQHSRYATYDTRSQVIAIPFQ